MMRYYMCHMMRYGMCHMQRSLLSYLIICHLQKHHYQNFLASTVPIEYSFVTVIKLVFLIIITLIMDAMVIIILIMLINLLIIHVILITHYYGYPPRPPP